MIIETSAVTIRSLDPRRGNRNNPAVGIETLPVDTARSSQACVADQLRRRAAVSLSRRNNLVPFDVCVPDGSADPLLFDRHRGTSRRSLRFGFLSFLLLHGVGILTGDNNFSRYFYRCRLFIRLSVFMS